MQQEQQAFLHGTLSTAGIAGAAPTIRSLKKQAVARLSATLAAAGGGSPDVLVAVAATGPAAALVAQQQQQPEPDGDAGMRPRQLIPRAVNRPHLAHSTADIPGAQPHAKNIMHRPRHTNPLDPHSDARYTLPAASVLTLPCGPAPPDRLLRDTLDVRDIAGTAPRPHTRTRSAAATACTRGGSVLDASDIDGASPTWRPHHRRHFGLHLRDSALNVADINNYQPHPRPGPRAAAYKGHPGGPRREPAIRPRRPEQSQLDNSLRTLDIEGASVVLQAPRARQDFYGVADIDGAAPADRDRAHLFARRKAAAAATEQRRCEAAGVLTGLVLRREQLLELWQRCKAFDRDSSGFLTAGEAGQAMLAARLQLSAAEVAALTSALRDNAGLLNYRQLSLQLKEHMSRPASAPPAQRSGSQGQQQQQPLLPEQVQQQLGGSTASGQAAATGAPRPSSAAAAAGAQHNMQQVAPPADPAAAVDSSSSSSSHGWQGAPVRPTSAPIAMGGGGAARRAASQGASTECSMAHWCSSSSSGGSRSRDGNDGAAAATAAWRCSRRHAAAAAGEVMEALLPARPASAAAGGHGWGAAQQQLQRPPSATPPGLAERRRLAEAERSDRSAVRLLL